MNLTGGARLGPYQIVSRLGAGGMGEVYRARDTRLHRDVAIKVLTGHTADRTDLHERFGREARMIAALNHPHICVLHDIGHQDGVDYLVMEYLEGETLAERLKRGPLPLTDVLRYGVEIGDALNKAHRKGVTHRDLKPGNIILTNAGAKLLDFGLAKLRPPTANLAEQPTQEGPITAQGTILGTLHYMAPEQLDGKEADARSDLFAFGAVLYEMATGTRAFEGQSQASLIAAIMTSESPAMSAIQPMTPPALDRLVRKCLRKDPDARWQSAHDITDELRWIAESISHPSTDGAAAASPRDSKLRYAWVGVAVAVAAAALVGVARFMSEATVAPVASLVRFAVGPPENGDLPPQNTAPAFSLSVSPDGTMVAFAATDDAGRNALWIRNLGSATATALAGTEGALWPFWSPDNRFVGFFTGGRLMKAAVSGGPAQTVANAEAFDNANAGAWSRAGVILFSNGPGPLSRVSDAGGTATRVATELDAAANEVVHAFPSFLPDGDHYLFLARSPKPEQTAVYVGALSSKERKRVLVAASPAVYVPPGYVLFHRDGTLMAQPFDVAALEITGEAAPVADSVQFIPLSRAAAFAASQTGMLAYRTAIGSQPRTLVWVTRTGMEQALAAPARGYQQPRLSPDGRRIAVQIEERDNQIWVYDTSRGTLTRLTFQGSDNEVAIWTPDGKRLTYFSDQAGGAMNLFWQPVDGSSGPERLTKSEANHAAMSWSLDGRRLAYTEGFAPDRDIWVLDMSDRKPVPFIKTSSIEGGAQFSPDGRWIAYISNESGRAEVYVQPYPGPGGKWQVSTDGGSEPMWNRNGRELFYRSGDRMIAVPISMEGGFSSGRPQVLFLFERRYASIQIPQTFAYYDVSPDGQRFLMVKEDEQPATLINVVLNWHALLKR